MPAWGIVWSVEWRLAVGTPVGGWSHRLPPPAGSAHLKRSVLVIPRSPMERKPETTARRAHARGHVCACGARYEIALDLDQTDGDARTEGAL
jgi:hypothetical protein